MAVLGPTFSPKRLYLFVAILIAAVLSISLRVPVIYEVTDSMNGPPRTYTVEDSEYAWTLMHEKMHEANSGNVFEQIEAEEGAKNQLSAPPVPEFIIDDSPPNEALDIRRYFRRLAWAFAAISAFWFIVIPGRAQIRLWAPVLPLLLYFAVAIWRLIYLPCTLEVQARYLARPAQYAADTRPFWNVGHWNVRYELVIFEEAALLFVLGATYACAFALVRNQKTRRAAIT